jgi:quercetin dioxygenase-like cupin family protein
VSITVLDIESIDPESEGGAEARRFLNAQTVGAEVVEGTAYRLAPGASIDPQREEARYQLFYVTSGEPVALYQGERHRLAPGRGVYCDPGETCAFENPTDAPAAFYRFVVTRS